MSGCLMESSPQQSSECAKVALEYCSNASLHGLPWVARSSWSGGGRAFWISVVALGMALCMYMSNMLSIRFNENPTIYVMESVNYPALKIPFPTVEICNSYKLYKPNTEKISNILHTYGYNESRLQYFFKKFFGPSTRGGINDEHLKMLQILEQVGYSTIRLYEEVRQPCTAMLIRCAWRNLKINCSEMFSRFLGSNGYCCRFVPQYFRNNTSHYDLNYVAGFDEMQGLSLFLNLSNHKDFDSDAQPNSARISAYHKDKSVKSFQIVEGQRLDLAVNPSLHTITDRARMMPPDTRGCGYVEEPIDVDGDLRLRYSSYDSCVYHYFIQNVLDQCNCTLFNAIEQDPMSGWEKTRMCTTNDYKCVEDNNNKFGNIIPTISNKKQCLPPCYNIAYECSTDYSDLGGTNLSQLNIYFQDRLCHKYTRDESMSPFQHFAAFGGIFGICLGGTVISIIEFLCFIIKFFFVTIFRCKRLNNPEIESNKTNITSEKIIKHKFDNRLYLNELLPYGYSKKNAVLPKVVK